MIHHKLLLIIVLVFSFHNTNFSQSKIVDYVAPTKIGETIKIQSTILKETRAINLYLPKGYESDSVTKFPIIYVLDSDMKDDFTHVAGIVQYGSKSWVNIVPKSIVVGLPNSHKNRDFVAKKNEQYSYSGGSGNFMNFIEFELIPFFEKNFRTLENRTIIGKTLGGLFVGELLMTRPHLFTNFILLSPTLSWDNSAILKVEPKLCLSKKTVYIGVGEESKLHDLSAKKFYLKFKNMNVNSITLHYKMFEEFNRSNIMFTGTYNAFTIIFSKQ
ncbi:MAG: alpha/beta hydrolase [Crocinitomicaceae bacterium]